LLKFKHVASLGPYRKDQEKIFFSKLEVGFLGADEYDPLGLTEERVTNFFVYPHFSLIFFQGLQNGP
jgi:hypothetical protein